MRNDKWSTSYKYSSSYRRGWKSHYRKWHFPHCQIGTEFSRAVPILIRNTKEVTRSLFTKKRSSYKLNIYFTLFALATETTAPQYADTFPPEGTLEVYWHLLSEGKHSDRAVCLGLTCRIMRLFRTTYLQTWGIIYHQFILPIFLRVINDRVTRPILRFCILHAWVGCIIKSSSFVYHIYIRCRVLPYLLLLLLYYVTDFSAFLGTVLKI